MRALRTYIMTVQLIFALLVSFSAFSQDEPPTYAVKGKKPGPILKTELWGLTNHYSKLWVGVEYFTSDKWSIEHKASPIISIENLVFLRSPGNYSRFWGLGLDHTARYYFNSPLLKEDNRFENKRSRYRHHNDYIGFNLGYHLTAIDTYDILGNGCGEFLQDCDYFRNFGYTFYRHWLGVSVVAGTQKIFDSGFVIDISAGIGLRALFFGNERADVQGDEWSVSSNGSRSFSPHNRGFMPFLNLNVGLGYALRRM